MGISIFHSLRYQNGHISYEIHEGSGHKLSLPLLCDIPSNTSHVCLMLAFSFASALHPIKNKRQLAKSALLIAIIRAEPNGKASFFYSCMQMKLMVSTMVNNPLASLLSKQQIPVMKAILDTRSTIIILLYHPLLSKHFALPAKPNRVFSARLGNWMIDSGNVVRVCNKIHYEANWVLGSFVTQKNGRSSICNETG